MSWAEHSVEIEAPIEVCFDAIVDYESFPGWQNAVDSVEVIDRHGDGLGRDVRLFVDAKVRKIDYVLRYGYERPTQIEWDFVEGNGMRDVDGIYTFEQVGENRTRATYKLGADPEIPLPGVVARRVHKQLVKRSVEDLKAEAERRAAAAATGAAEPPAEAEKPQASRRAAEAAAPSGDRSAAASGWVPKAERDRVATAARSQRTGGRSGAVPDLSGDVAGRAASAAGEAVRTGRGLAKGALRLGLELGRDAVDRVDRVLSGRGEDERR
ncbi:MAG TPA: SRPBCC family protein [Solirubrobacterales bacterium]|jgi:uncharacterized membrane protein|nr:SRPBCC family protein [Solirubrobacterales bacterium]